MDNLLETIATYVPALIVRYAAQRPSLLTRPFGEHLESAIFFADIAGFTTLTEQFMQREEGIEELSLLLNAYFSQLIDLVIAHGGDIFEFTGDGILALWTTNQEDLATVVYRAVQCGMAAQQLLQNTEVYDGMILSVRIGIGAGEVYVATVGGVLNRWELLVSGHPIHQASMAQERAKPGELVLSPKAWNLVQGWCIGYPIAYHSDQTLFSAKAVGEKPHREAWSQDYPLNTAPPVDSSEASAITNVRVEQVRWYLEPVPIPPHPLVPDMALTLRAFLPGALLARLDAGLSDWVAELRRVTVLFINIYDLEYDASDILEQLQVLMQLIQMNLYHYEGSLNQFIVDDKGTLLIAAMGLPPLTHEDDAVRGIHFAMDTRERLMLLGLRCAIGITTGRIFCGSRGSSQRRDYAMIGDVMNVAARLMVQAGPGDILCDQATYQAARSTMMFEALKPVVVKGKTAPVMIYRPHNYQPPQVCTFTQMIGRENEKALLQERLHALAYRGEGSIVLIEGEAGMGKSTLVSYLLQHAHTLSVTCLTGTGYAIEHTTSLYAWRSIFRQIFGLDNPNFEEIEELKTILELIHYDPEITRLVPLLKAVLPIDIPENEITIQMSGQVRADNTRELLLRIIQAITFQSPTLIVLEDANWLDSASWVLVMAISQQLLSLMLVITTRPMSDPTSGIELLRGNLEFELSYGNEALPTPSNTHHERLSPEYIHLLNRASSYRLVLDSLSSEDMLGLVCSALQVDEVPEAVSRLILQQADGNPFFCQELAYAMRDTGLIIVKQRTCRINPDIETLGAVVFPDTIQGVIISRIDRLPQSQQLALKVASVIGSTFPFRMLRDVYPIEQDRTILLNFMHIFEQLDIVTPQATSPELIYRFKHVIMQEVIYNLLLFTQRRELHRAVAEWYEHNHQEDLAQFYELLVYHWSKADVDVKVVEYAEKAGEWSLRHFANQEAVRLFTQALDKQQTITNHLWQARIERLLGEAYLNLGKLPESRRHLERAVTLLGRPVPTQQAILILRVVRQIIRQLIHRVWTARCTRCTPEERRYMGQAAHTYGLLLSIYYFANNTWLTLYASLRCLNLAERADAPSIWLGYSYANMCISLGSMRLHKLALDYGRRSMNTAWQVGDLSAFIYTLNLNALYRVGIGQWRVARAALELALTLCERLGDWTSWGRNWTLLAQVSYYQGNFDQSFQQFAQLSTNAQQKHIKLHQIWSIGGQGQSALRMGKLSEACKLFQEAISWLAENEERLSLISNYGLLAIAHLHQGAYEQAREAADTATQLMVRTPLPMAYYLIEGYAGIAEVYVRLCERNGGLSVDKELSFLAQQACDELRTFARSFPIGQPRAQLWQGLYEWLSGKHTKAMRTWRKGLNIAQKLNMPFEQSLLHQEIACHSHGHLQKYHQTAAHDICARLGTTPRV